MKSLVALLLSLVMVLSLAVSAFAADGEGGESGSTSLKAGAGAAAIKFEQAMFASNVDGFSGEVESDPYMRVLLIEDQVISAIVIGELVNIPSDVISSIKTLVSQAVGADPGNVWVHANHTITTPHAPSNADEKALYSQAVLAATEAALEEAQDSFQDAVMGIATGTCDVNANRNKLYDDGNYYVGNGAVENEERGIISNKTMTIVSFASAETGDPIGMVMSYGIKPTTIDNAEQKQNTRKISSDLTGLTCVNLEEEYGCPVMFLMGASGDQIAKETTNYYEYNEETGKYDSKFESVEVGVGYVQTYAATMTSAAKTIADSIEYDVENTAIRTGYDDYTVNNSKGDGTVTVEVYTMAIGDQLALVGLKPEIDAATELELWEESPFENTLVASFTNGDQKYMPHDAAYDEPKTVEGKKSGFARGAAETFVEVAANSLAALNDTAKLHAGAGSAAIKFDQAMFASNVDGFDGSVLSDPYLRVLLVDSDAPAAMVIAELVNVPADVITSIQNKVSEVTGIPTSSVWVHANHTITTPHAPSNETERAYYVDAVMTALDEALEEAVDSYQPATMGIATGTCDVNANRNKLYGDGSYYVGNGAEENEERGIVSNKEMTIIGFEGNDGSLIGVVMSYGVKPTTIDNAEQKQNTRKISADLTGLACANLEEELECPVMFLMGASGDQIATETTNYYEYNEETGKYDSKFESVAKGQEYVEKYGAIMTEAAADIIDELECDIDYAPVQVAQTAYTSDNAKGDGTVTVDVYGMTLGDDVAFIGLKPEVDAQTERELWEASPYTYTMMASFTNGDQKYMPHAAAYDEPKTVEGKKSGFAKGAAETYVATAAQLLNEMKNGPCLYAGAGEKAISFPQAMFASNVDGFDGSVESDPYARVLILNNDVKSAIVQLELVNVPADVISLIKAYVNQVAGVPEDNVFVHANHTITTPHAPSDATEKALYNEAVMAAVEAATDDAVDTLRPAKMGVATGNVDVNANRNKLYGDGNYYVGNGAEENEERGIVSNKQMTIIGFEDYDGNYIGMTMSYGVKPTTIDNAEQKQNTRKISSDLTGLACVEMGEKYDCPVLFIMGASGDQIATKTTNYYEYNEETGKYDSKFESVAKGIEYVEEYGAKMVKEACEIADTLECTQTQAPIVVAEDSYTVRNSKDDGDVTVEVYAMTLGDDVAFIGLKPEVDAQTERELWEQTAELYAHTMMASFTNGDQKYMPHDAAYDEPKTVEGKKSGFARGAAETYVETAVELLGGIKDGSITNKDPDEEGEDEYKEYETTEFAGISWYVLDTDGTKQLLLSEKVLEKRAFNTEETDVTWENCTLREYLNGLFYEQTLGSSKKIVEVTNKTESSSYGISGGNDTQDKVFVLSVKEAEKYIVNSNAAVAVDEAGNDAWWTLRSRGEAVDVQTDVTVKGEIDYHGPEHGVANTDAGIRPAIWIDTAIHTADEDIKGITAIGTRASDGAKINAIILEYADEIVSRGKELTADDFEVVTYDTIKKSELSSGTDAGAIKRVYINDVAEVAVNGKDRGTYVIIELNDDFVRKTAAPNDEGMAAGIKQVGTLTNLSGDAVQPSSEFKRNFEANMAAGQTRFSVDPDSYIIEETPEAPAELANKPAADGNWYVYRDGEIATDVTTVAHNDNGWWYVENGKVDFTANTVAHNENGWWVIENGKVNFNATGVYHNDNGWWYCKDGKVDFTYNGFGSNANGDWYCENGKVNFDVDDIIYGEVKGVKAWWYVVKSKVTYGEETIAHNSNGWWYVGKDGKVDFTANTVAHNMNGWWMVENGKVTFTYNGLGTNANGTWYIKNSKVDFTFNGTYGGKTIVNGKVQ